MVVFGCVSFVIWTYYCYNFPNNWIQFNVRHSDSLRHRMKDYYSTTVMEEAYGNQFMELCFAPHAFHHNREDYLSGYTDPDDIRRLHLSSFNRPNKIREHYLLDFGNQSSSMDSVAS